MMGWDGRRKEERRYGCKKEERQDMGLTKKRGKEVIGSKGTSTCVIFVDDVNMPMVEKYGAQPPIELLR